MLRSGLMLSVLMVAGCQSQMPVQDPSPILQNEQYIMYADSIVQGQYVAKALSPTEITSNYKSQENLFKSPTITFKFSINGKDNEMVPGKDHYFNCLAQNGVCETPVIKFGEQFIDNTGLPANAYLKPDTKLKIRLDMREVLEDFEKQGYYQTLSGDKIFREDFKTVYVAGSTAPLIWDFDNLYTRKELELKDPEGDGIYEVELLLNAKQDEKLTASHWKLTYDIASFPQYSSEYPLIDALYNMGLEEMLKDIEEDSTFRTGKEWAGVWTRDISYSIILSMASLQPKVSQYSLMRKVKNGRIIQDTGTGGAYPVSTDRIVWAIAAWELYKVTGDQEWLKEAYTIVRNSLEDDLLNAYDTNTGLFRGESSFLDWREQTYPDWMQPVDIYESENLGTNAVFYQASVILSKMARMLGDNQASEKYALLSEKVKEGINRYLWMDEKGYFGQYLYGRNFKLLSPRAEALGEALVVLFNAADQSRQQEIVVSTPVTAFGVPSIYPQIPNIPPYHNNGIWPFVQAYWSLAAAKAGNEEALLESLSALYRPAALFLTNKENFVASSGDYAGTQINSDRQLWSVAGNVGMVYKVFFGMDYLPASLVFKPFVPKALQGKRSLTNFRYRNAILNIAMEGYGNEVASFSLDGKELKEAIIPASLEGSHDIRIVLANNEIESKGVKMVPIHFSPAAPKLVHRGNALQWNEQEGVKEYMVLKNGQLLATTNQESLEVELDEYAEYQVLAIGEEGFGSFASEPLALVPNAAVQDVYEMEEIVKKAPYQYRGFSGNGFIELSKKENTQISFDVEVPEDGFYAIDFKYSNGSGPINTENKCAIRTLRKGEEFLGTVVMPQRGTEEWSDWGYTNSVQVPLQKGIHSFSLSFEPANENMNIAVNKAMLDFMRVTKIGSQAAKKEKPTQNPAASF